MAANIQTIVAQVGIHENINHVMIETIQTAGKGIQYTKNYVTTLIFQHNVSNIVAMALQMKLMPDHFSSITNIIVTYYFLSDRYDGIIE